MTAAIVSLAILGIALIIRRSQQYKLGCSSCSRVEIRPIHSGMVYLNGWRFDSQLGWQCAACQREAKYAD